MVSCKKFDGKKFLKIILIILLIIIFSLTIFWWCYTPSISSFLSNKPTEATIYLDVYKSTEQLKKEKADFMDTGASFESYELAINKREELDKLIEFFDNTNLRIDIFTTLNNFIGVQGKNMPEGFEYLIFTSLVYTENKSDSLFFSGVEFDGPGKIKYKIINNDKIDELVDCIKVNGQPLENE